MYVEIKETDIKSGDLAMHKSNTLDERVVAAVFVYKGTRYVVLDIIGKLIEPVPAKNYTYSRAAD